MGGKDTPFPPFFSFSQKRVTPCHIHFLKGADQSIFAVKSNESPFLIPLFLPLMIKTTYDYQ